MHQTILDFWFNTLSPQQWWEKNQGVDRMIKEQFFPLLQQAKQGELAHWRDHSNGRLAEIIILDQFSRNIYRGTPEAFAQDGMALILAQEAIRNNIADKLPIQRLAFVYMPFMHSESKSIHQQAIPLFEALDEKSSLDYELKHKKIIDKFGRYPHRNAILNRPSTDEEKAFLTTENSGF